MATLQFKPDELLKKMRIKKYAVDQLIGAEPYSDRPLTPKEVEEKQKNQPGTSPYLPGKSPIPSRKDFAARDGLKIASGGDVDPSLMNYVTVGGFFLDGSGKAYMQTGGKLYDAGEYNPDVHGLPVPLAEMQARNGMKIAQNKTPSQQNATNMVELMKKLTKEGKHVEAQALYKEQFPRA